MNKWFYVMDMHSGGGRKTPFEMYFIESESEEKARAIFTENTGEDPDDVACDCCGANFSIGGESDTLEECVKYHARSYDTVKEYLNDKRNLVKVIRLTDENILL
jgi:hypothetical protein